MRFCSTPESAATGEITFLAILETVLAISLSVLLVKLFDRSVHIVVGALLAPFLLLRTESSTAKAFSMFDSSFPRLMRLLSFFQRLYQRLPAFLRLLTIYGPTVLYRRFLKSPSLISFPLIWVSRVPMTPKGILSFPIERVRRWYSGALILLMLSPLAISYHAQESMVTARDRAVFSYILPVHRSDWWHLTRIAAVAVTIALYFYAKKLAPNE